MKPIFSPAIIGVAALLYAAPGAIGQGAPQTMNFQGRLARPDGTPLPDTNAQSLTFRLYDAADGGNLLWEQTIDTVAVHNGTFAVPLDFSANYQNANTEMSVFSNPLFTPFLEIQVGSDAPLTPRRAFASVAYSLAARVALSVPDSSIMDSNIVSVDWSKITNVPTGMGGAWTLSGNAAIDANTNFLGTTDNTPLIFKVNGFQAMRYDYAAHTGIKYPYRGINVLGGIVGNSIAAGVVGATIAGGGNDYFNGVSPNRVNADFGTISGGAGNTVTGPYANVAGGSSNTAGSYSVVAGGSSNSASDFSAVGGGFQNAASGESATIAGGDENVAGGLLATVAGGAANAANGDYSFAAGFGAQALHLGAFVWADGQSAQSVNVINFASTGPNQFLIRAAGGVGIGTSAPDAPLTVAGNIHEGGSDFRLTGRGGGAGNNSGLGRALVDNGSGGLVLNFANDFGKVVIGGDTYVQGQLTTNTLNLQGADLAEKFDVQAAIAPGMVVEIDTEHEGKLKLASGAYNRRVAGIVSGAGKLPAGVVLSAPNDKASHSTPIAMSGRVWVYTDATTQGVEPGDFLTTAERPGYAMPTAELSRAQGAILGKAMTRLRKGEAGLVLVLVNLQ